MSSHRSSSLVLAIFILRLCFSTSSTTRNGAELDSKQIRKSLCSRTISTIDHKEEGSQQASTYWCYGHGRSSQRLCANRAQVGVTFLQFSTCMCNPSCDPSSFDTILQMLKMNTPDWPRALLSPVRSQPLLVINTKYAKTKFSPEGGGRTYSDVTEASEGREYYTLRPPPFWTRSVSPA